MSQPFPIAAHPRELGDVGAQSNLVLCNLGRRNNVPQELPEIDVAEGEAECPGLDARGVKHVVDQPCEPRRFVADQPEERLALLGRQLAPPSLQRPCSADDGRHRASQLVGHERDEIGAQRGKAAQLIGRAPFSLVRADVLNRGRDQPPQQRHELELFRRERIRLCAHETERPDRSRPDL